MKRIKREELIKKNFITCECGYNNFKQAIDTYGKCNLCGKILNERAFFKYKLRGLTRSFRICNSVR